MRTLLASLALSLAACAGTATYSGTATYDSEPDLVYADDPGVQVVADYDDSVFYADNAYWRHHDGQWYRSNRYNTGWTVSTPSITVSRIRNPEGYRHYHPRGYVAHRGNRHHR